METLPPLAGQQPAPNRNRALMKAAQELEATFLAEMLSAAGLGTSRQSFGGGAGEDQFASFLAREQARVMVQAGGIGLSQSIYDALKEREDDI